MNHLIFFFFLAPLEISFHVIISVLSNPYNMGEAALLESLIIKATFENKRYQKPKKRRMVSTEYVDWC